MHQGAGKQRSKISLEFKENGGVLDAPTHCPYRQAYHKDRQAALCGLLVLVPGEIMKPIQFNMKGTEYALTIKIATYPEGNLAIKLYQESFGQLIFWDSLTVNPGGLCPKDCGFINTKSTGKRFYAWIKRNGLGERTGQVRLEGGVEYVEYLFNAKKLKKLDPDGYTYYERRLKGELGRKYERLYQALRRLANHIPDFCYTDYSGWRRLQNSNDAAPLRIEAKDPAHHRHFTFEQRGIMLRTTITDCDTNIAQSSLYRRREDMAADLLALFQDELPVYMPWSEERRRISDARHDPSLAQTFQETTEVRQKAAKKKSRRRSAKV